MENSEFCQIAFRDRWKFSKVRAIANFAMEEIFDWVVGT